MKLYLSAGWLSQYVSGHLNAFLSDNYFTAVKTSVPYNAN